MSFTDWDRKPLRARLAAGNSSGRSSGETGYERKKKAV